MNKLCLQVFLLLILISVLESCVKLNENLAGQPTTNKFFRNLSDFEAFIRGAYTPFVKLYGTDAPYIACAGAEDVNTTVPRWKGFEELNINTVANPNEITDELWNNAYSSISSCNTIIPIIQSNTTLAQADILPIQGEAKFLRAFAYFHLVRWFGEIPLITEKNQTNAGTEPQSSVATIYNQIVADLHDAENTLPEVQSEKSRATKWAAKALLSKVFLTMAGFPLNLQDHYDSAKNKSMEVINSKKYSLMSNYFDLWLWDNRMINPEFIFTFYASFDNGTGGYVNRAVRPVDGGEGGWADWCSDKRFLAEFPINNNSNDSTRLKGTFYLRLLSGIPWEQSSIKQPFVGKLRDGGPRSNGYTGGENGMSNLADGFYCMLRYADVLLIYAEAANKSEGSPSSSAYDAINQVRTRAGLDILSGLNSTEFDQKVLEERNWELAFECNRWFDLCRRHIVKDVMQLWYPNTTITDNNYLLPKPTDQLRIMLGVKQNPGYNF